MALRHGEDPLRSLSTYLDSAAYPIRREALVEVAGDDAPVEVINMLKSLPADLYLSKNDVQRDLSEAARRFASGQRADADDGVPRDRRNIGRDLVEGALPPRTRHP